MFINNGAIVFLVFILSPQFERKLEVKGQGQPNQIPSRDGLAVLEM